MTPEIENAMDRLAHSLCPPGRFTQDERCAVRGNLQRLVQAIVYPVHPVAEEAKRHCNSCGRELRDPDREICARCGKDGMDEYEEGEE